MPITKYRNKKGRHYRMSGPSHAASMYRAGLRLGGGKSKRPARNLKAEIKKVVAGTQETKFVIDYPFSTQAGTDLYQATAFTSGITTTNELYNLIPRLTIGSGDHQRIGNSITPVSLYNTTSVYLPLQGSNSTGYSANVYVDVFYLTSKQIKTDPAMNEIPTASLLNNGDGTNVPYDGTAQTADLPVNKSAFNILMKKRVNLKLVAGDPNGQLSGGSVYSPATSLSHYEATWKFKVPLPSKLLYNTDTSTAPTNSLPFMCLGFHARDMNGDTAPTFARVFCRSQSQLYYKDG